MSVSRPGRFIPSKYAPGIPLIEECISFLGGGVEIPLYGRNVFEVPQVPNIFKRTIYFSTTGTYLFKQFNRNLLSGRNYL
jgi:hypothetical protein